MDAKVKIPSTVKWKDTTVSLIQAWEYIYNKIVTDALLTDEKSA